MQPSAQPSIQPSMQPSAQPSTQPSFQPSSQPTVRPTSSRPTGVPSAAPSKYPTTTAPTLPGETNNPSRYPTSRPSVDLDYFTHSTYLAYVSAKAKYTALEDSFTFSSYYYKGVVIGAKCSAWNSYKDNNLNLPFDDIRFNKVTLRFDYFQFDTNANRSVVATCTRADSIAAMITALRKGTSLEVNCNDRTWRVFSCNGNVIFCVNCKRVCVDTEICPGKAFAVNTCTNCGFRSAASTVVNFQYGLNKLWPQFLAPIKVSY